MQVQPAGPTPAAEILPPGAGLLRVVSCPHPFTAERDDFEVEAGMTIAEILEVAQPDPILRRHAHVYVGRDGRQDYIRPEDYGRVRPKAGTRVTLRVVPGNSEGGGKDVLATVLQIVIIAAAVVTQQYWAVPLATGLGVSVSTATALGMLAAPPAGALASGAALPPPAGDVP